MSGSAYEQFLKWKASNKGQQFTSAIQQAQREAQLSKFQAQFKLDLPKKKQKTKNSTLGDEAV